MSCLLLIARVFALPLAILLCDRLQLLNLKGDYWDVLWITILLGVVNVFVRPFVEVSIIFVSHPVRQLLRPPRALAKILFESSMRFIANVTMLWLVCKLLGIQLPSPWQASLVITAGSIFASFPGVGNMPGGPFPEAQPKRPKDDSIDI